MSLRIQEQEVKSGCVSPQVTREPSRLATVWPDGWMDGITLASENVGRILVDVFVRALVKHTEAWIGRPIVADETNYLIILFPFVLYSG